MPNFTGPVHIPVHIAAAVGTPVADVYALTNPQHTPWAVPHRVLFHDVPCKYCYKSICPTGRHECLRGVSPAAVVVAARELLDAGRLGRCLLPLPLPNSKAGNPRRNHERPHRSNLLWGSRIDRPQRNRIARRKCLRAVRQKNDRLHGLYNSV